jgi:hypothetical protein
MCIDKILELNSISLSVNGEDSYGMHAQLEGSLGISVIRTEASVDTTILINFELPLGCYVNTYELQRECCNESVTDESMEVSITAITASSDGYDAMESISSPNDTTQKLVLELRLISKTRQEAVKENTLEGGKYVNFVLPVHLQYFPAMSRASIAHKDCNGNQQQAATHRTVTVYPPQIQTACGRGKSRGTSLHVGPPVTLHAPLAVASREYALTVGLVSDVLVTATTVLLLLLLIHLK